MKTGVMPRGSLNGPAIAELKRKQKLKSSKNVQPGTETTKMFARFEDTTGAGRLANTPLSMHSEMMAIQSVLAVAGSLASDDVSSQKPCCKSCAHGKLFRYLLTLV